MCYRHHVDKGPRERHQVRVIGLGKEMLQPRDPLCFKDNAATCNAHSNAFEPILLETKSPLPGNGIFRAEIKRPKRARRLVRAAQRQISLANPANSGLVAEDQEISVSRKMRGGAERTRTACQARSRYRTGLSRVIRPHQLYDVIN